MADGNYYGYVPGSAPRIRQLRWEARHMGEDSSHYYHDPGGTYQETAKPPDKLTGEDSQSRQMMLNSIEMIYKRIVFGQSYTLVLDAAFGWRDIADYLNTLAADVRTQTDALRAGGGEGDPGWSSTGADMFMAHGPGATLMSIDRWAEAAEGNHKGLSSLATHIAIYHGKMKELMDEYQKASIMAAKYFFHEHQGAYYWEGTSHPADVENANDINVNGWMNALKAEGLYTVQDQYYAELKQVEYIWTHRAQQLEYDMGQGYWQIMRGELNPGGSPMVFEGPTNAVVPAGGATGNDMRDVLRAIDRAQALAGSAPAIDVGSLPSVPATLQLTADLGQLPGLVPNVDVSNPGLTNPPGTLPTAPDIQVPVTSPGFVPVVPPPLPVNPGALPGLAGGSVPTVSGGSVPTLPGNQNITGPTTGLPGGVLSRTPPPNLTAPGSLPPPPPFKGGKIVSRQNVPPQGATQGPGTPGAVPPAVPGAGRPGQRAPQRPMDPAAGQFGGPPPGGTTSPVLGGRQRTGGPGGPGGPGAPGLPAAHRTGPTRAGTAPPVLGGRNDPPVPPPAMPGAPPRTPGRERVRPTGPGRPDRPVDAPVEIGELFPTAGEMGTMSPMVQRHDRPPVSRDLREVPRALRHRHHVMNSPAELAARRKAAADRRAQEERELQDDTYRSIRAFMGGEEPWTVQTPGGPVIAGGPERPTAPPAEPRPTLGA